jgi:glycosyltransferase involved in cell wall biosynthesis
MRIVFDSTIFGWASRSALSRCGIYRYGSELLVALSHLNQQLLSPASLIPYCSNPLLIGAAENGLTALEERAGAIIGEYQGRPIQGRSDRLFFRSDWRKIFGSIDSLFYNAFFTRFSSHHRLASLLAPYDIRDVIYHSPFLAVPPEVRRLELKHVVVTIHDMLPILHPEYFTRGAIGKFNQILAQLRPTDHVICVSQSTKSDFLRLYTLIPPSHVHVTPLAASPHLTPVDDRLQLNKLRHQLGLGIADRIVLSLCTLEPRKNLITLIEAFEFLHAVPDLASVKLVLAGSLGWKTSTLREKIRSSSASDFIVLAGHFPDQNLATLYSLADVFVYPSLYEGFGLPPLEAMQCGTAVVTSNTSSLPEVAGSAASLVNPHNPHDIKDALHKLLQSPQELKIRRELGLAQASQFSWCRTASQSLQIYRSMLACSDHEVSSSARSPERSMMPSRVRKSIVE